VHARRFGWHAVPRKEGEGARPALVVVRDERARGGAPPGMCHVLCVCVVIAVGARTAQRRRLLGAQLLRAGAEDGCEGGVRCVALCGGRAD
jgi:mRNA-degrading endonuclease toxin of MazEF toxin-antitoxin module